MSYLQIAMKANVVDNETKPETKIVLVKKKTLPMTERRKQSLTEVMDAMIRKTLDEIATACNGKQFISNDAIKEAEDNILILHRKVLTNEAKLKEFNEAIKVWKNLCLIGNENKQVKNIGGK